MSPTIFYDLGWFYAGAAFVFFIVRQPADGVMLTAAAIGCAIIHCYRARKKAAELERTK